MEGSSSASSSTYQHYRSPFGDTTLTKVFVGGLAWETPTEKMREYFEQFGEILEAVIIADKNTGKSKGYGFVTFGDPESAKRAVADSNPMIDGRRANCNIAATGRPARQSPPRGRGQGQSGQIYYPGGAQGGSSSVQGPLLTAPPPVPQSIPVMYPPYGYNPAYGYNYNQAAFYNQQLQQAQYYHQMYGSGASSTSSPNLQQPPQHIPYYYTYSMQAAAARAEGYPTMPQHAQRNQGPYFYYSSHSPLNKSSTGSYPVHSQLSHRQPQQDYQPSVSSDSSRHQQLTSQIDSHESSQVTSPEPEAKVVIPSEASSDV